MPLTVAEVDSLRHVYGHKLHAAKAVKRLDALYESRAVKPSVGAARIDTYDAPDFYLVKD